MASIGKVEKLNLICCHFIVRLRLLEQTYSLESERYFSETENLIIKV